MLVSDFHFDLPQELIAQQPLPARDLSRMLHVERSTGRHSDLSFRDFPTLLRPTDLLVFNNTRVFPARLYGRRDNTGSEGTPSYPISTHNPGRIEVLLTRQLSTHPNDWECLARPGRKIGVGEYLFFGDHDELQAEVLARGEFGERRIRFQPLTQKDNAPQDFYAILDRIGHVPLPPYIARPDSTTDRDRYQTVYARERGSVAAPTAGLHFTPEILARIRERGIETAEITLHVGLGTFQPVRVDRVEDHKLHSEPYSISPAAAAALNNALRASRRIIAVGTTTVRTLEHAIRQGAGAILPGPASADLFIHPASDSRGFEFKVVGALLTNFHLPQSTLLMLVCALGGKENILRAYEHAVAERYRFYSYGDCMFLE
jgi:S-adenosylmethionine:tRNA ribosyltransferase-isomerase